MWTHANSASITSRVHIRRPAKFLAFAAGCHNDGGHSHFWIVASTIFWKRLRLWLATPISRSTPVWWQVRFACKFFPRRRVWNVHPLLTSGLASSSFCLPASPVASSRPLPAVGLICKVIPRAAPPAAPPPSPSSGALPPHCIWGQGRNKPSRKNRRKLSSRTAYRNPPGKQREVNAPSVF